MDSVRSPKRLLLNSFLYEECLDWGGSLSTKAESCLNTIAKTALQAWYYHPGRFADGALENWAFRLGSDGSLLRANCSVPKMDLRRRRPTNTLHVVTEVYPTGGHTRFLAKWISRDTSSDHGMVLTQQSVPLPEFFQRAVAETGSALVCLPQSEPPISRASQLRNLSKEFDRVILHAHPNDPIPVAAFASSDLPPVAMLNIGHWCFCLGATVSDLVVDTQEYAANITRRFRYARRTTRITAVPGENHLRTDPLDKALAKERLGFSASTPVVMSIANEVYFRPIPGYNFFQTASRVLREIPCIQLLVVGLPPSSGLIPSELKNEPRCHFVGPVIDPEPYYRAADVCLESFPMASPGGFLESVAYGEAFPVPVYGEREALLRVRLAPWLEHIYQPRDEEDYVDYVARLISNLPRAREQARQLRLSIVETDKDFGLCLEKLNQTIDAIKHEPAEIPTCEMIDSYDCRMLAELTPLDVAAKIDELLPFDRAIQAHLRAGVRGFVSPQATVTRILNKVSEKDDIIAEREKAVEWLQDQLSHSRLETQEALRVAQELEDNNRILAAQLAAKTAELDQIKRSVGWRLLSLYGRIKYRYLLPLYRWFHLA